jgi:hypothetical protein
MLTLVVVGGGEAALRWSRSHQGCVVKLLSVAHLGLSHDAASSVVVVHRGSMSFTHSSHGTVKVALVAESRVVEASVGEFLLMNAWLVLKELVGVHVSFTLHVGLDNEFLLCKTLALFVCEIHVAKEFLVFRCGCLCLSDLYWFLNGVVITRIQIDVEVLHLGLFKGNKSHGESFNDELLGFFENLVNAQHK